MCLPFFLSLSLSFCTSTQYLSHLHIPLEVYLRALYKRIHDPNVHQFYQSYSVQTLLNIFSSKSAFQHNLPAASSKSHLNCNFSITFFIVLLFIIIALLILFYSYCSYPFIRFSPSYFQLLNFGINVLSEAQNRDNGGYFSCQEASFILS